jgi:hypothetical protein
MDFSDTLVVEGVEVRVEGEEELDFENKQRCDKCKRAQGYVYDVTVDLVYQGHRKLPLSHPIAQAAIAKVRKEKEHGVAICADCTVKEVNEMRGYVHSN